MIEEPHPDEPIRFFKDLYAVVVGVGLALAAEQIVDLDKTGVPIRWEDVPLFVAWMSVALPFAHVFVRYLDFAYRRKDQNERGVRIRAMSNIVFGAGQYIWIIALALFLSRPLVFGYSLVLFLAGMIGRELYLRLHPRAWISDLERRVGPVQAVAVAAWLVVLISAQVALRGDAQDWAVRGGVLAISLGFAFGIYLRGFEFFFAPTGTTRRSG